MGAVHAVMGSRTWAKGGTQWGFKQGRTRTGSPLRHCTGIVSNQGKEGPCQEQWGTFREDYVKGCRGDVTGDGSSMKLVCEGGEKKPATRVAEARRGQCIARPIVPNRSYWQPNVELTSEEGKGEK